MVRVQLKKFLSSLSGFVDVADPAQLMKEMRSDGLALKQGVLGRKFNPLDPNQVKLIVSIIIFNVVE